MLITCTALLYTIVQTNANISKYGKKRRNHNNRSFQKRRRRIPVNGPIRGPKRPETGPLHDYPRTSSYHGVSADSDNVGMFMVRICVSDTEIDGGTHRGELAAAHAYDSLITMLELDDEFPLNFKDEVGDSWQPLREHDDDVGDVNVGRYDNCIIPVVQNELFTLEVQMTSSINEALYNMCILFVVESLVGVVVIVVASVVVVVNDNVTLWWFCFNCSCC